MTDYKRKSTTSYRQNSNRTRYASSGKKRKSSKKRSPFQKWLSKNTSKIAIGLAAFIGVILITLIVMITMTLSYDKVYDGIYLNNDCISYMTKDQLRNYIEEKYSKPITNITIRITSGTQQWHLDASNLNISFNIDAIVDSIYSHGHTGNIFERLNEIYTMRTQPLHINIFEGSENEEPLVNYDESIIDTLAAEITQNAATEVIQHQINIEDFQVSIVAGSNGYAYKLDTVKNALLLAVNEFQSAHLDIRTVATVTTPNPLDVEAALQQINKDPVDASYKKVNDKEITISPSAYGISVERSELEEIVSKLAGNPGSSFSLTVTKLSPSLQTTDLVMPTYPDILGEKTTSFSISSSQANRNINLKLAAQTLDGYILLPGEQFSFNGYIGDTTADKGYLPAAGYSGGKVTNTYGGGICQVSTTLYNAVINSVNLTVNQRFNHSSTVSYVPKGLDCMISYGYSDFKFTNNTNYPIKIEGVYNAKGKLTFRILGINEYKDIRYEFISTQLTTIDYNTTYTEDPGEVQSGKIGGKWKVERVTYQNDVEIKRESFSTSSYRAMNKIVLKTPATPTPTITPTATPSPTPSTTIGGDA